MHEQIEIIKYREGLVPPIPIRYRCHCKTPIITEQQTHVQEWLQTNSTHSKRCHILQHKVNIIPQSTHDKVLK